MTSPTASIAGGCTCACEPTEAELNQRLDEVLDEYREKPGGLIPALQTAQSIFGYLPEPAIRKIADSFGKTISEVTGVITFYSFFTMTPKGEHPISICLGTACYVRGAEKVLEEFRRLLKIQVGETTPDGKFSLSCLRCVGACGLAPVVMVGEKVYGRVAPDGVKDIVAEYTT